MRWLPPCVIAFLTVSSFAIGDETTSKGMRYVIAVAPTKYVNADKFRALAKPEEDAGLLLKALVKDTPSNYAVVLGEKNGSVNPALKPTTANVRQILVSLAAIAKEEDEIIFYAGGHGFENDNGSVFCPADASFSDPNSMIYVKEIADRLDAMAARKKLVIVDACREFRDTLDVNYVAPENPLGETTTKKKADPDAIRVVIEACNSGQYAYEVPTSQSGILTTVLLEGLEKKADVSRDGQISVRELLDHIRVGVPRKARATRQVSQNLDVRDGSDGLWTLARCQVDGNATNAEAAAPFKSQVPAELATANRSAPVGSQLDVRQSNFRDNLAGVMNRMNLQWSYDPANGFRATGGVPNLNGSNLRQNLPAVPNFTPPSIPNPVPSQFRRFIP